LGFFMWDRQRTVYRIRLTQDKNTIQMITMAALAYGLNDHELFEEFSPIKLTKIARDNGVILNEPTQEGIPMYTGTFVGFMIDNEKTVNAVMKNGKATHYIEIQGAH
jgi:hypothetical protein